MRPNLFQFGSIQSAITTRGCHALDTASPMFDKPEFLKYSANNAIAEFGDAFADVFDCEPEREQAGVFDLQAIIKQSDADGSAALGVIGMDDSIHNGFTDSNHWIRPKVRSFYRADDSLTSHVLPQERNYFVGSSRKIRAHFHGVEYPASVIAGESANLNPCVRVVIESISAEEKDTPDSRNATALVARHDFQGL
jgi:hypothetical protein